MSNEWIDHKRNYRKIFSPGDFRIVIHFDYKIPHFLFLHQIHSTETRITSIDIVKIILLAQNWS